MLLVSSLSIFLDMVLYFILISLSWLMPMTYYTYVVLVEYRSLCTLDCSPQLGVGTHEAEIEN